MSAVKMYNFGGKDVKVKTRAVGRSTTAVALAKIPKGSRIIALVLTGTASDSATSANLSFGTTSANSNELVNTYDVKTAANGQGPSLLPSNGAAKFGGVLANDTVIFYKYAEVGGATVGSWNVHIVYTDGETTR
jgi:hypothetical protein